MTLTDRAIRAFTGPANAGLRRRIRQALDSPNPRSVLDLRRTVALTAAGEAKLQAVWQAWESENPVLGR